MSEFEEGMDFIGAFNQVFASSEKTQERLKAERKAGQTAKQRSRKKPVPTKQINFRATAETKALLDKLAAHLDKSVTEVIALAVEALARAELGGKV
jgi:hypothetical protein